MCNHYRANARLIEDWAVWAGYKPAKPTPDEVWPKGLATVARQDAGRIVPETMRWGVPLATTGKSGKPVTKWLTNVRNLASPFWKNMLARPAQRCLVPFSSFAEPKAGKDPATGRPAEYWFSIPSAPVAAFAGIWRPSEAGNVFAFLTCEPNPLVAPLHPKAMPVILQEADYAGWLDGDLDAACGLALAYPSQLMVVG